MLKHLFKTKHQRDIKSLQPEVDKINQLEDSVKQKSDEELRSRITSIKDEIKNDVNPNNFLHECFAIIREVSQRQMGLRHYDVQLIGGLVLNQGKIAEMKTGEGKTLMATLAVSFKALTGKGVHIITVNDYLAKRDAVWMSPIYYSIGLRVGIITNSGAFVVEYNDKENTYVANPSGRREAYEADITYGTNNEFGFDYLRDNMVVHHSQKVQRPHFFAVVDEVDSVLIDEARTPLIISGPSESNVSQYYEIDKIIPRLKEAEKDPQGKEIPGTGDYTIDLKDKNIVITEDGVKKIEKLLEVENLYASHNVSLVHHVNQALKAHKMFKRDDDYIVEGGQVVIVDEFTGRKMEGRRYSDGLHQAIEAKERVNIVSENQTLASITFQNYFRLYEVLSGMTGTADTESEEFKKIYELEVTVIPTNVPIARQDEGDKIFRNENGKYRAIIRRVKEANKNGQPVLIGTESVEKSEILSRMLNEGGLRRHEVLNAKNHTREAQIVENAGQLGAITIATNMAGRGTDIKLGKGVKDAGGLLIVGSERHESRRIDNQLRGRAGRQGDVGGSVFYVSMKDDLMKRFPSERIAMMMERMGMEEDEEIEHKWLTNALENAQKKVEGRNFDIRKHLLEYDDVMNAQRKYIYRERDHVLYEEDVFEKIMEYIEDSFLDVFDEFEESYGKLDESFVEALHTYLKKTLHIDQKSAWIDSQNLDELEEKCLKLLREEYQKRRSEHPPEVVQSVEKQILLQIIDRNWKDHLLSMDHLREGITLRSYGEKKPITEFKNEGFKLFKEMQSTLKREVMEMLFQVRIVARPQVPQQSIMQATNEGRGDLPQKQQSGNAQQLRSQKTVGRNEPCYCGSGKKYKHCHGKN